MILYRIAFIHNKIIEFLLIYIYLKFRLKAELARTPAKHQRRVVDVLDVKRVGVRIRCLNLEIYQAIQDRFRLYRLFRDTLTTFAKVRSRLSLSDIVWSYQFHQSGSHKVVQRDHCLI